MTEDFTPTEPGTDQVVPEVAVASSEAPQGVRGRLGAFYATTIGKVVVIGCALSLLGAILAIVAVAVIGFLAVGAVEDVAEQVAADMEAAPVTTDAADTEASKDVTSAPPGVPNSEVYTFRDIFKPLLVVETADASGETTAAPSEPDTIYLLDMTSLNGVPTAVLLWNGTTYYLGEGDQIPGTPWLVLDVRTDSAVMLYGDTQVTLYIGQGMASR